MSRQRVLAGACARVDPETFRANLRSLRWQRLPQDTELDLHYVIDQDPLAPPLAPVVEEFGGTWELSDARPQEALYSVGQQTHLWSEATFEHLARHKQKILDKAKSEYYDYVWIVDTDLVLDPSTLASALSLKEPVVSSVFWTPWQRGAQAMPQVWLAQPYAQEGKGMSAGEFWDKLSRRKVLPVAGGGACMLVERAALEKAHYWPRLEGLPSGEMWQGEDRTFSILCERRHVAHVADGWPDIAHMYHPEDRATERLEVAVEVLGAPRQERTSYGDLVNFTLESLDDPGLLGRTFPVRGRLGGLWLVPEIESALLDMKVGQQRFLEIAFPVTWPLEELRGKQRVVMLRLVDAKPFGFPPRLSENMFKGVEA